MTPGRVRGLKQHDDGFVVRPAIVQPDVWYNPDVCGNDVSAPWMSFFGCATRRCLTCVSRLSCIDKFTPRQQPTDANRRNKRRTNAADSCRSAFRFWLSCTSTLSNLQLEALRLSQR